MPRNSEKKRRPENDHDKAQEREGDRYIEKRKRLSLKGMRLFYARKRMLPRRDV